jgi:hypothetical protein
MSDLMMNTQTYASTTYPKVVLSVTQVFTFIIKSDVVLKVARFLLQHKTNTESTDKQKKFHFFNASRSTSELMMNVHTCVADDTTYTMLYVRPRCLI